MAVAISPDSLRSLGSDTSYERGMKYANDGRVGTVSQQGATVRATVAGREPYGVRLVLDGDALAGHCSCPMGAEGEFCKHCVALAIVWSAQGPDHRVEVPEESMQNDPEEAALRLSRDDLVDLVVGQAARNPGVAADLFARAGMMAEADDATTSATHARIVEVLSPERADGPDVYFEVEALVEELAYLVRGACSDKVVALVEEAAGRWEAVSHLENEVPEIRDLEEWLGELVEEAHHLASARKPLVD